MLRCLAKLFELVKHLSYELETQNYWQVLAAPGVGGAPKGSHAGKVVVLVDATVVVVTTGAAVVEVAALVVVVTASEVLVVAAVVVVAAGVQVATAPGVGGASNALQTGNVVVVVALVVVVVAAVVVVVVVVVVVFGVIAVKLMLLTFTSLSNLADAKSYRLPSSAFKVNVVSEVVGFTHKANFCPTLSELTNTPFASG